MLVTNFGVLFFTGWPTAGWRSVTGGRWQRTRRPVTGQVRDLTLSETDNNC